MGNNTSKPPKTPEPKLTKGESVEKFINEIILM